MSSGSQRRATSRDFFTHRPSLGTKPSTHVFSSGGAAPPSFAGTAAALNAKRSRRISAPQPSGGFSSPALTPRQALTSPPELSFFLALELSPPAPAPKMSAAARTLPLVPVVIRNAPT